MNDIGRITTSGAHIYIDRVSKQITARFGSKLDRESSTKSNVHFHVQVICTRCLFTVSHVICIFFTHFSTLIGHFHERTRLNCCCIMNESTGMTQLRSFFFPPSSASEPNFGRYQCDGRKSSADVNQCHID